jgi:hypothetical protein
VRRGSHKPEAQRAPASEAQDRWQRDFELWESELRQGRLSRWAGWLLRAFGDVANRDGFVLVTGGGVCWHCYVPSTDRPSAPRPTR